MQPAHKLIGKSFGKYKLEEIIGIGGMATVYKAHHANLARDVAVKVLNSDVVANENFSHLFIREARNLANLSHPNILQVYDFDIEDDMPYLVTEYIDGPSLKKLIKSVQVDNNKIPIKKCVRIVKSVAEALQSAHQSKIVHLDIKPANVLMEKTGRVVLADFGISKMVTGNTEIVSGSLRGTPAYMAPEIVLGNPGRSPADMYSLGVIFYELVTGQLPFDAEKALAITIKHVNEKVKSPRQVSKDVPRRVEKIILKAMEKNPKDRYKNMQDMLKEVNRLKEAKTEHLPTATLSSLDSIPKKEISGDAQEYTRITLHFLSTGQILDLPEGDEYSLGRVGDNPPNNIDVDLTPFKGLEWGISRNHAKFVITDKGVELIDLGSLNGTVVEGNKLEPNLPHIIEHGTTIKLGKLKIQVLIYKYLKSTKIISD